MGGMHAFHSANAVPSAALKNQVADFFDKNKNSTSKQRQTTRIPPP
jgi:hypothetical protein